MAVTVRVVVDRWRFSWALIDRSAVKRGGRGGGGGGGGGNYMYLSGPIDTKRQGCCTSPLSGSIQRAGLSSEVDASSPLKLWDLRAGLSACKMCPYGAHPHLAVFWV